MGILNRLFGQAESTRPEDYQQIYVRWDVDGNSHGPFRFVDLIRGPWSGPPLQARFENESKWSDYRRFTHILDRLEASDEQVAKLVSKKALTPGQPRPGFREAIAKFDALATEDRTIKAKLLATSHMRKKMDSLGIAYQSTVTREEAKALVSKLYVVRPTETLMLQS